MKRLVSIILSLIMCISLCGCNNSEKAFELSKSAFNDIEAACEKLDLISQDILAAWELGLYNEDELYEHNKGFAFFCTNICTTNGLSRDDILDALAVFEMEYDNNGLSLDYYLESVREYYGSYFGNEYSDDGLLNRSPNTFSACVALVEKAYVQKGTFSEVEALLASAKTAVMELSQNYPEYEHYETVKEYFAIANSYFALCSNPSGSYLDVEENVGDYTKQAEDCYNRLYYFFEQ